MILPDLNLLLYAHNDRAPQHSAARAWWEDLLTRQAPIAVPWLIIAGFVRLTSHSAVFARPLSPDVALDLVEQWLAVPSVVIVEPGPRHLAIVRHLFVVSGATGSLATDVHLAALAIEHSCALHSNDTDFARFPGLRWVNPLA